MRKKLFVYLGINLLLMFLLIACGNVSSDEWAMIPFVKQDKYNPCLTPNEKGSFVCPVRKEPVHWEAKDVFNPAAVVRDGKIYLLYRAEDRVGKYAGTSRIGLAVSEDGYHFTRYPAPVLYPDNDFMKKYEWEGGCEDPRIVQDYQETYYLTYTAYDGQTARLCVATSNDLIHWEKQGLAFKSETGPKYAQLWSKSGSIICKPENDELVAQKIDGKYWMYWGESDIYAATSENLTDWHPITDNKNNFVSVFSTRKNKFDSQLVEPGPPALIRDDGILFIYNSKNSSDHGNKNLSAGTYAAGQVLLDTENPVRVIRRMDNYFFAPTKEYEITGQVNNVCFLEGLVHFRDKWFLYYGTADSKIAVAVFYQPL